MGGCALSLSFKRCFLDPATFSEEEWRIPLLTSCGQRQQRDPPPPPSSSYRTHMRLCHKIRGSFVLFQQTKNELRYCKVMKKRTIKTLTKTLVYTSSLYAHVWRLGRERSPQASQDIPPSSLPSSGIYEKKKGFDIGPSEGEERSAAPLKMGGFPHWSDGENSFG